MSEAALRLLVVAGEASGDQRGAGLLAELRRELPALDAFGLGGDQLAAAGLRPLAHSREIAVVGIAEVLRVLGRARQIFRLLLAEVERQRPAAAVLIDAPDFNLRLARQLARRGIPVVYYVSPQFWAWRQGRVRAVARSVERMLVLFPFEEQFYRRHGVRCLHVGHPLVDEIPPPGPVPAEAARAQRVLLLPGSRDSEVAALLPAMAAALERLRPGRELRARLLLAPTVSRDLVEATLARVGGADRVEISTADRVDEIGAADLVICASGTATLEVGLLERPMVVVYRMATTTYWLARLLVRVPHVALVNLVLGERAVPELIQHEASPAGIAALVERLLDRPEERAAQRARLGRLRSALGAAGASRRAAAEVKQVLLARRGG